MPISFTKIPIYHHIIFLVDLVANCGDSRCVLSRNGQEVDLRFERKRKRKELKMVDFSFLLFWLLIVGIIHQKSL